MACMQDPQFSGGSSSVLPSRRFGGFLCVCCLGVVGVEVQKPIYLRRYNNMHVFIHIIYAKFDLGLSRRRSLVDVWNSNPSNSFRRTLSSEPPTRRPPRRVDTKKTLACTLPACLELNLHPSTIQYDTTQNCLLPCFGPTNDEDSGVIHTSR